MRDILLILALCLASALAGMFAGFRYQENRVSEAKNDALGLRDANEKLVAEKQKAISERDSWQRRANAQRQEIYDGDEDSADWGAAMVPKPLSDRVRDAARSTDAAAAELGRSGMPARSEDSH